MSGKVLILGANGRFGSAVAEAFWNRGWRVRLFDRATDRLPDAAIGADVIVNGWNPPYDRWAAELPSLTERVIDAARASGATILQAANVYVYGDRSPEVMTSGTPHAATNPLGRLRIDMERRLRDSGVPVILLRAGDFIDTEASGNWLDRVILAKLDRQRFVYPGDMDVPHAWAYLPDLAEAAVALAERRDALSPFEDIPFPGYTLSGRDLAELVAFETGRPLKAVRMSWLPLHLARLFWKMAGHLLEMRYLWNMPHRLDATRFEALVPGFRATDPGPALRRTVRGLGRPSEPVKIPTDRRWSIAALL